MPFTLEKSGMWLCLPPAARGCRGKRCLLGVQEGGLPPRCPLPAAPVRWQGVPATSVCLGTTPATKITLPPWPQGRRCTGREKRGTPFCKTRARGISTLSFEGCPNAGSRLRAGVNFCSGAWRVTSACVRAGGVGTTRLLPGQGEGGSCRLQPAGVYFQVLQRKGWNPKPAEVFLLRCRSSALSLLGHH